MTRARWCRFERNVPLLCKRFKRDIKGGGKFCCSPILRSNPRVSCIDSFRGRVSTVSSIHTSQVVSDRTAVSSGYLHQSSAIGQPSDQDSCFIPHYYNHHHSTLSFKQHAPRRALRIRLAPVPGRLSSPEDLRGCKPAQDCLGTRLTLLHWRHIICPKFYRTRTG